MKEFVIPFTGLKTGGHTYDFEIGKSFFEAYESDLLEAPEFKVHLELEKSSNMLVLNFTATGVSHTQCDRCGSPLDVELVTAERIVVKFGDNPTADDEGIIVLHHSDYEIDVSQIIYEMIVIAMPAKRVHARPELCDQEALKRLSELEKEDLEEPGDPRWDALKNLRN